VIQFVCAELNYGGRVTDDKDLRLIKCIFDSFVNTASLQDNYAFSPSKTYRQIPAGDQNAYLEYIR
jgi:dynein heavy chain